MIAADLDVGDDKTRLQLAALSPEVDEGFPAIDDYAIVGDCKTAALVARSGAVEWLCLPDFDSPSWFAAILDRRRGGSFTLRPGAACVCSRRYAPDTAVLETTFSTSTGCVRVIDFMSIGDGNHPWATEIVPQRELIRIVQGLDGSVDMMTIVEPRPDYGRRVAAFTVRKGLGWVVEGPGALMTIDTDFDVALEHDGARLVGRATIGAGESRSVSLTFAQNEMAVRPAVGDAAFRQLEAAEAWWRGWAARCIFEGPRRPMVVRSAITLKLLTYSLSGAVVAAATTSLPESIGAGRNWDYRFCWLRDSSVTMHAFLGLNLQEEADSFIGWLLNATRLTRPELRILYDLHGRNDATEKEIDLGGYRDSRPVRVGNGAGDQLQLDTYGSVILAAYEYIARMGTLRGGEMRLLRDFGEVICRRWEEPDHGLWEVRGAPRHFTATKVMCWVALDRVIKLAEDGRMKIPLERFRKNRDALAATIETRGFNQACGAYVGELDGGDDCAPDAAVLLMAPAGYGDPASQRMRSTLVWIMRELGRDGLLARYPAGFDGDPSIEGAFGICLSWAIESMVRQGDLDDATRALDRYAETANDLGLFAEEYDVLTGSSLGNFPQAFSHAGFVAAALAIEKAGTEVAR